MFWKKRSEKLHVPAAAFPNYVVEKVARRLGNGAREASILDTARKHFKRGMDAQAVELMLHDYGRDTAMLASLGFAIAVRDARGQELSDLEYADCYLCAIHCLTMDIRHVDDIATELLTALGTRFQTDTEYLVFAPDEDIDDLNEAAWDRYGRYHRHGEAILPRAYVHLLSQIIRHRRAGHDQPYQHLDPMLMSDPIIFASLEQAWEGRVKSLISQWQRMVFQVQQVAEDHDDEFWADLRLQ